MRRISLADPFHHWLLWLLLLVLFGSFMLAAITCEVINTSLSFEHLQHADGSAVHQVNVLLLPMLAPYAPRVLSALATVFALSRCAFSRSP